MIHLWRRRLFLMTANYHCDLILHLESERSFEQDLTWNFLSLTQSNRIPRQTLLQTACPIIGFLLFPHLLLSGFFTSSSKCLMIDFTASSLLMATWFQCQLLQGAKMSFLYSPNSTCVLLQRRTVAHPSVRGE